jgi:hypothetical protein
MPFVLLVSILSVGANIFLLSANRQSRYAEPVAPLSDPALSRLLSPRAFGQVHAGFIRKFQQPAMSGGTLFPVSGYVVPPGLLPALSDNYPLYRDQGAEQDQEYFTKVFQGLKIPFDLKREPLNLQSYEFKTADGLYGLTLKLPERLLSVRTLNKPGQKASSGFLNDEETIQLARGFAVAFGIETGGLPVPHLEVPLKDPSGDRSVVVWPLQFSGSTVIDLAGLPVAVLRVGIDRRANYADSLTLNLLSPDVLMKSDYPAASSGELAAGLLSGGLLPLGGELKGKPVQVTFTDAAVVYVLRPGDNSGPTYLVPAIKARWDAASTCAGCATVKLSTFVPLLSPKDFVWYMELPAPVPPIPAPKSSSGSVPSIPLKAI